MSGIVAIMGEWQRRALARIRKAKAQAKPRRRPVFQMISDNGIPFVSDATVELSTVQLPLEDLDGNLYETLLRVRGGNEVIDRYQNLNEAVAGHLKWEQHYRCFARIR